MWTGTISPGEAEAYAAVVQSAIRVEMDGTPLAVELLDTRFPTVEAIHKGEGAIRIVLTAAIPRLSAGPNHLLYRNSHRGDIGVYLANILVPASDRVSVSGQRRDVDQRELIVDYVLDGNRTAAARTWFAASIAGILIAIASLWRRSRVR